MKILYGVQGTGNGHITRARAMAVEMKLAGIKVDFVFSGRPPEDYFDMSVFGDYRTFRGLSFVARNGKLNFFATVLSVSILKLCRDIRSLDTRGYDLVITDFEPIVAWAAKSQGVLCIGFGHQYAFKHDIPRYKKNLVAQWVMSNFAPSTIQLGAHWHHFGYPILPPLIHAEEIQNMPNTEQVLVYLPFENSDVVLDLLEEVPSYHFRLHCKDIDPGVYGNVEVFPFSRDQFQQNLNECESVLCNAGFELNSEALQLGRRILVKPLKGQIEQHSNAIALERLGIAKTTAVLNSKIIQEWLETSRVVQVNYPNVARAVVAWLQVGNNMSLSDLCVSLWQQTPNVSGIDFTYPHKKRKISSKPVTI
ncbi:MJ1255/VC2487 family glycosyltransferase [Marinomonas colpomeniae]|uniref:Glycosyltransferase n=1 Tax=Marinomonas colpomeniae TaxID=2774408 RepID=A0ABR8NV30_9GAMM|nr:MJ1255/VC2487 family glycosyltransferase [Marinomonas colpomeniae]MBD5769916.1 glycosyltransferase [Marinomonas colpomeniae]